MTALAPPREHAVCYHIVGPAKKFILDSSEVSVQPCRDWSVRASSHTPVLRRVMAPNSPETQISQPERRRIELLRRLELCVYLSFVASCTLLAACSFFRARGVQLGWAEAARTALDPSSIERRLAPVWWSAPLDDTFIHFDFARSFANFRPFEWTQGGGYSSGATSWLYPMVLAVGVLLGQDGQSLGTVADVIACGSVFAFLWGSRSLFGDLPRWTSYLLAPFVLTSGVLGWSLWSGMELALFFGVWGLAAHYYADCRGAKTESEGLLARRGLSCASLLLVMTRPEALACCCLFALFAVWRSSTVGERRLRAIGLVLAPPLIFTGLRALTNGIMTGSFADAGAIVKLHTLRPFLEPREVAMKWLENVAFQFARITTYHTSDEALWGWQVWILALLALWPRRTRTTVVLLLLQAITWLLLVAQSEYVRYQNDRYTMPVVLFLLVAIALGLSNALTEAHDSMGKPGSMPPLARAAVGAVLAGSFVAHQFPRLNQQRWLFGRASRNIAEQQIRVGQLFRAGQYGPARRVLVGDAGAIPFFSGLRGLDAIGLGGTQGLPFAKAVNLGVGATVELIEHLVPEERPDRLAIYPSWWGLLPVWFGRRIDEVRIKGNVICGAADKAIYEAEWRGLEEVSRPAALSPGHRLLDELDFADVLSESEHEYHLSSKHSGYVVMRILPNLAEPNKDLFDAGRLVFSGATTRFHLAGFKRGKQAALVFRAAPDYHMAFHVRADGRDVGRIELEGGAGWQEPRLELDPRHLRETVTFELIAETSEHTLYHVWATGQ